MKVFRENILAYNSHLDYNVRSFGRFNCGYKENSMIYRTILYSTTRMCYLSVTVYPGKTSNKTSCSSLSIFKYCIYRVVEFLLLWHRKSFPQWAQLA